MAAAWEIVAANEAIARFRTTLPALGLEVTKTYRLEKVPADHSDDVDYPAYSLMLDLSVANVGDAPHEVAYRLDGPTGLPTEGSWYAIKVRAAPGAPRGCATWSPAFKATVPRWSPAARSRPKDFDKTWSGTPLDFVAVDAQYFAVALIPQKHDPNEEWFAEVKPVRMGAVPPKRHW